MAFFQWLWSLIFPPKTVTPSASSIGIGVTSDIGAVAGTLTAATNLASKLQDEHNTASMIAAKEAQYRQDRIDAINLAISKGDLNALRKLSSP